MTVEVVLPKVDMDMETGVIAEWKVAEGAFVRAGDVLFDMETAKSIMEVEAPASGVIRGLAPVDGEAIAVGTVVATIDEAAGAAATGEPARAHPSAAPVQPPGAAAPAPDARLTGAAAAERGNAVRPQAGAPAAGHPDEAAAPALAAAGPGAATGLRATPYARTLAREHGVDLATLHGSGPRGRIGAQDVQAYVAGAEPPAANDTRERAQRRAARAANDIEQTRDGHDGRAANDVPAEGEGRLVPFTPTRRVAARRLAESVRAIPHFYVTAHMDMSALRAEHARVSRAIRREAGSATTMTVVLAHVIARTLSAHPLLNASVEGDAARLHDAVHLGVAMDRDGDLVVPVLRDAGTRSLAELTAEFRRLRDAVRSRTITPADLRGATFGLSSLEMHGVDAYTAIINPPQSAILAIGRTVDTPVGRDGQVVLRPVATLTLSSDHRIVDGVTAARFMADLRRAIEAPAPLA